MRKNAKMQIRREPDATKTKVASGLRQFADLEPICCKAQRLIAR